MMKAIGKIVVTIMVMEAIIVGILKLTGCEDPFPSKCETTHLEVVSSGAFDSMEDYEWFCDNVFHSETMSDEEKQTIYEQMTGDDTKLIKIE